MALRKARVEVEKYCANCGIRVLLTAKDAFIEGMCCGELDDKNTRQLLSCYRWPYCGHCRQPFNHNCVKLAKRLEAARRHKA